MKKIDLNIKVLNSYGNPIIFNQHDFNSEKQPVTLTKEMNIFDVIVICLNNTEQSKEYEYISKLSDLNNKLIELSKKDNKILKLNSLSEINFLTELIINDSELSNLIKSFVISKI